MTSRESSDAPFKADHLDRDRIRFEKVAGVRTRLWEGGAGEPLVLVHGGEFGDLYSLDSWSLNFPGLAGAFHVLAFDRPGQGLTDNPRTDDDYTIGALMVHLTAFVEAIAPSPAHIVGHSRGGFLVTLLALERPDLVRTVTIVDSNTAAPENPEMPSDRFYIDLEKRTPGPPTPHTVRVEPELQSYSSDHITEDFVARRREISLLPKIHDAYLAIGSGRRARWETGLSRERQETLARLARSGITVPVLVVWGRDDPSAPLPLGIELFDRICERSETAEFHIISRAGHYAFREQPRIFNRLVSSFCRSR